MNHPIRTIFSASVIVLFGAGCQTMTTARIAPSPAREQASPQPSVQEAEPVPDDSENIDLMIQSAQREDQVETTSEKKDSDMELQQEQKDSIETKASAGVDF
jgi:hypothetical protein